MPGDADLSGGDTFGAREREYLESLPAVREVRGGRIYYSRAFREQCVRRYMEGESPVMLFREAGLDPKLIGYKRIERAFARWTRTPVGGAASAKAHVRREAAVWALPDGVDVGARVASDAADMAADASADSADVSSGTSVGSSSSAPRVLRRSRSSFARSQSGFDDARDRLIARQALRISELEDQLAQLRQTSQSQPSASAGSDAESD